MNHHPSLFRAEAFLLEMKHRPNQWGFRCMPDTDKQLSILIDQLEPIALEQAKRTGQRRELRAWFDLIRFRVSRGHVVQDVPPYPRL